jgi:hypothetical protein
MGRSNDRPGGDWMVTTAILYQQQEPAATRLSCCFVVLEINFLIV